MNRLVPFVPQEYYHIYNRGTNKMEIFLDKSDYQRFLKLLYTTNSKETLKYSDIETSPGRTWTIERGNTLTDIGAYCLMPNHFHLLVKGSEDGNISLFLQRLLTAYSMYFNKKYNRTGSLFQGKSKSKHINNNEYLKYIFSYIHLNPVKLIQNDWKENSIRDTKSALEYLDTYTQSSYLDFTEEKRKESLILNTSVFPEYFPNSATFKKEILEWITYEK